MKIPNNGAKAPVVVIGTAKQLEAIASFVLQFLGTDINILIMMYKTWFEHVSKHEGTLQACKKAKEVYNVALRYAARLKFTPIKFMKSNRDGLPKVLKTFGPLLRGNPNEQRAALTVLQLYKLVDSQGDFSTESITSEYAGSSQPWWLDEFDRELQKAFPPDKVQERINQLKPGLHVSGKKGPNGPALVTAPVDREAIRGHVIEGAISKLAMLTNNSYLETLLDETSESPMETPTRYNRDQPEHSRIRIKYESGGKARAFCICDYFSQSALSPIHKFLMEWLKAQDQDGTNDHSDAAEAASKWSDGRFGKNLWSFDLTTATDRYPRFLEKRVIAAIFGKEIADEWETVISLRDFVTPNGDRVRFAAGQPLGALSSWATFAVTHHIHIRTAGRLCRLRPIYKLIGDDITIARDEQIAQRYIEMMNDLSVPFSGDKSVLPWQMEGEPTIELAKRLFYGGVEITPVPPDEILVGIKTPMGLRNLVESSIRRGYDRARQVYPVQSSTPSQEWLAIMTFPIRNRLPQIHEVKFFRPFWEDLDESPPGGLNPGWFYWSDYSDEELTYFLRELLLSEVNRAYKESIRFRNTLYEWSLIGPDIPIEGGDWQPEPWNFHETVLPRIIDYMTERLEETILDLQTAPKLGDPYKYIGGLHSFLNPKDAFVPRSFKDEKVKTEIFISKSISKIGKIVRSIDPIEALITLVDIENTDP